MKTYKISFENAMSLKEIIEILDEQGVEYNDIKLYDRAVFCVKYEN